MKQNQKKVLLLADRYETRCRLTNLGDQALLDGIHRLIQGKPGIELISGPWKYFPYFNIKLLGKKCDTFELDKTFSAWNNKVLNYRHRRARLEAAVVHFLNNGPLFDNPLRQMIDQRVQRRKSLGLVEACIPYLFRHFCARNVVEKIAAADIVIFNGFGLLADHLAHFLPGHLLEVWIALKMNKRVVTVNQTVNLNNRLLIQMIQMLYQKTHLNLVREPLSAEALVQMGIASDRVIVSPDSAFAIPISDVPDVNEAARCEGIDRQTIILTVRGDRLQGVEMDAWVALVNYIQQTLKRRVVWIHTSKPTDHNLAEVLRHRCNIKVITRSYGYMEIIGLLKHAGLLITDRYHPCIFAIIAGCPVLPFESNTFKVRGLFKLFDYPLTLQPTLKRDTLEKSKEAVYCSLRLVKACRSSSVRIREQMQIKCHNDFEKFLLDN